jgi:hypothetical protein
VEVTAVRRAVFLVVLGAGCALAVLRPLVPEAAWAFALPRYFLVINILSVVLCFRTLNQATRRPA